MRPYLSPDLSTLDSWDGLALFICVGGEWWSSAWGRFVRAAGVAPCGVPTPYYPPGARGKYTAPLEIQRGGKRVMVLSGKIVGRGVDTLLVNVYYTDAQGKPQKHDLAP